jgi:ubiquinol-cytochrome c reductase cytochrome c subunit
MTGHDRAGQSPGSGGDRGRALRVLFGWIGIAVAAAVGLVVLVQDDGAAQQLSEDEVRRGGELYAQYCIACHGPRGEGGVGEGDLEGPPINDIDVAYADLVIRTGRMPIVTRRAAIVRDPGFDDDDREQIVAWMTETFGLEGEVPEVSEGDPGRGRILFNEHCAACHSTTGKGGVAGGGMFVLPARFLDPVAIVSASRVGPFGMPRFSEEMLSDEDLADIATAVDMMDAERPSPLAITDVTHVSGTVYAVVAMILLLGLVGVIAKMPRITPAVEEEFEIDDDPNDEGKGAS